MKLVKKDLWYSAPGQSMGNIGQFVVGSTQAQAQTWNTYMSSAVASASKNYQLTTPTQLGDWMTTQQRWPRDSTLDDLLVDARHVDLAGKGAKEVLLPDGARLILDERGNYRIEDQDAKVVYKANRIREFNPYLNASDLLAKFIGYCGTLGVRQDEVLRLPVELFVQWLVVEAAARDDDPLPEGMKPMPQLVRPHVAPRCRWCRRFVPRWFAAVGFGFCDPLCALKALDKAQRFQHKAKGGRYHAGRGAVVIGTPQAKRDGKDAQFAGFLARLFPDLAAPEVDHVVWNLTGYPTFFPRGKDPMRSFVGQLVDVRRKLDTGVSLAEQEAESWPECPGCRAKGCRNLRHDYDSGAEWPGPADKAIMAQPGPCDCGCATLPMVAA